MQSKIKFFVVLATIALLFNSTACDDYSPTININIVFTLSNGSGLETHMWVDGEDMSPSNKLMSGTSRSKTLSVTVTKDKPTDYTRRTVYVGRNGSRLGYQEVEVNCLTKSVTAFYDGTYLSCSVK
jgi:hypothetical protein